MDDWSLTTLGERAPRRPHLESAPSKLLLQTHWMTSKIDRIKAASEARVNRPGKPMILEGSIGNGRMLIALDSARTSVVSQTVLKANPLRNCIQLPGQFPTRRNSVPTRWTSSGICPPSGMRVSRLQQG